MKAPMTRTVRLAAATFLGSLGVGMVLGYGRPSEAVTYWFRRSAAGSCTVAAENGNESASEDPYTVTADVVNRNQGYPLNMNCRVDDSSDRPKTSLTGINLHGRASATSGSNKSVFARVCVRFFNSDAGHCFTDHVTTVSSNTNYVVSIAPEASQTRLFILSNGQSFPGDFGYIHFRLPSASSQFDRVHYQTFRGYYLQGDM